MLCFDGRLVSTCNQEPRWAHTQVQVSQGKLLVRLQDTVAEGTPKATLSWILWPFTVCLASSLAIQITLPTHKSRILTVRQHFSQTLWQSFHQYSQSGAHWTSTVLPNVPAGKILKFNKRISYAFSYIYSLTRFVPFFIGAHDNRWIDPRQQWL